MGINETNITIPNGYCKKGGSYMIARPLRRIVIYTSICVMDMKDMKRGRGAIILCLIGTA